MRSPSRSDGPTAPSGAWWAVGCVALSVLAGCQCQPPRDDYLLPEPRVLMVTPDPTMIEAEVDGRKVSYLGMIPDRTYTDLLLPAFPQLVLASSGLPPTRRVVGFTCTVNEDGFRGPRRARERTSESTHRIGILGTGVTYGLGVDDDETYPVLLEKLLNEAPPLDREFEVLNFGIPCLTTDHAEPAFVHLQDTWKVDTWVIALGVNDALPMFHRSIEDYRTDVRALVDALATPDTRALMVVEPINTFYPWLQRYPPYLREFEAAVGDRLPFLDVSAALDCHEREDGLRLEVEGRTQRMVRYRKSRPEVLLEADHLAGQDEPYVAPEFYTYFEEESVYLDTFFTDVHLNRHGHEVMADILHRWLSADLRGEPLPGFASEGCGVLAPPSAPEGR